MSTGWVKLFRSLQSWQHYQQGSVKAVFIDLLLSVSFEPSWYRGVRIDPGCTPMSISTIEQHTGLSRKSVIHALKVLEGSGEITRTQVKNGCITRITNFTEYQSGVPSGEIITPLTTPVGTPISTPIIRSKELKNTDVDDMRVKLDNLREEMLNQGNVEKFCITYKVTPQQVLDITNEILAEWELGEVADITRQHFVNTFRIKAGKVTNAATRSKSKEQMRGENLAFMGRAMFNTLNMASNGDNTK